MRQAIRSTLLAQVQTKTNLQFSATLFLFACLLHSLCLCKYFLREDYTEVSLIRFRRKLERNLNWYMRTNVMMLKRDSVDRISACNIRLLLWSKTIYSLSRKICPHPRLYLISKGRSAYSETFIDSFKSCCRCSFC